MNIPPDSPFHPDNANPRTSAPKPSAEVAKALDYLLERYVIPDLENTKMGSKRRALLAKHLPATLAKAGLLADAFYETEFLLWKYRKELPEEVCVAFQQIMLGTLSSIDTINDALGC